MRVNGYVEMYLATYLTLDSLMYLPSYLFSLVYIGSLVFVHAHIKRKCIKK